MTIMWVGSTWMIRITCSRVRMGMGMWMGMGMGMGMGMRNQSKTTRMQQGMRRIIVGTVGRYMMKG